MVQDLQHKLTYEMQDALIYMLETDDLAELAKDCRRMDQRLKDRNYRKERAQTQRHRHTDRKTDKKTDKKTDR
jgi:hypothetical protein